MACRPVIAQQLYNVLFRQLDVEYFAFARSYELHTTVYNPLAGGLLTGKHSRDGSTQKGSRFDKNRLYQGRYFTDAMFDRVDALADARRAGRRMSLLELSYAWLAGAPGVDSILLGPASVEAARGGRGGLRARALARGARASRRALPGLDGDRHELRAMTVLRSTRQLDDAIAHYREHGWARLGKLADEETLAPLRARADAIMLGEVTYPGLFFQHDSGDRTLRGPRVRQGLEGPVAQVPQGREARAGSALLGVDLERRLPARRARASTRTRRRGALSRRSS